MAKEKEDFTCPDCNAPIRVLIRNKRYCAVNAEQVVILTKLGETYAGYTRHSCPKTDTPIETPQDETA